MQPFLVQAIDVLQPLLLLILTWVSVVVANWLRARVKNEYAQGALLRLEDAVLTVVKELEQTITADLREAASDGKIDSDEAKKILVTAVDRVKAYLGKRGVADLKSIADTAALEAMIEAKIEAAVLDLKNGDA